MIHAILNTRRALTLLALASLAACGGGGGGMDSGLPVGVDPLAINDANANDVARAGLAGSGVGSLAANLGTGLGTTGVADRAITQLTRRAQALGLKAASRARPQVATTLDCAVSGSVTVDFNSLNNNSAFDAVGESISITANACLETDGVTLDGSFSLTMDSFTNASNYTFTMAFTALKSQTTVGAMRLDGSLAVRMIGGNTLDMSTPGIALQATHAGASYSFSLVDFSARAVDRGDALVERIAGQFSGSGLGVYKVVVSTPVDLVQLYTDDYPSAGTMKFVGANGSVLKLDALDATQARLSIDANGDGSYETVRTVLWADLDR